MSIPENPTVQEFKAVLRSIRKYGYCDICERPIFRKRATPFDCAVCGQECGVHSQELVRLFEIGLPPGLVLDYARRYHEDGRPIEP